MVQLLGRRDIFWSWQKEMADGMDGRIDTNGDQRYPSGEIEIKRSMGRKTRRDSPRTPDADGRAGGFYFPLRAVLVNLLVA